jgi:hypothetical protein
MGRQKSDAPPASPQEAVRRLMKAGKVKRKCCKSKPRCKKCPVLALQKARQDAGGPPAGGKRPGKGKKGR